MTCGWLAVDALYSTSQALWWWPVLPSLNRLRGTQNPTLRWFPELNAEKKNERFRQMSKETGIYWARTAIAPKDATGCCHGASDSIVELESRFMSLLCDCGILCGRKVDGVGLVLRVWRIRGDPVEESEPVARTKKKIALGCWGVSLHLTF